MLKITYTLLAGIVLFGSCTSLKQIGLTLNRQSDVSAGISAAQSPGSSGNGSEIRFLNEISVTVQPAAMETSALQSADKGPSHSQKPELVSNSSDNFPVKEYTNLSYLPIQNKYAQLLGTGAEDIQNLKLFEFIDDWYGTRYCMGGDTKRCIDCSALIQLMYSAAYQVTLPRTSKEQYKYSRQISTTELREGDLLFFHTRGRGVSHVGLYLQNNKFVHASSSGGVTISDMYEDYFVKRLVGAGRVDR